MSEPKLVIGVAGRIGSGKSSVARVFERECGFQYLRYSLVLAEWFKTCSGAKTHLQQVGWDVMSGEGQRELNRRLIKQINRERDCVVDGLRHPIDFQSLNAEFGTQFYLIYINTSPEIRFERLRDRYSTYEEFLIADSHPVESHIESLKCRASIVLLNPVPIDTQAAGVTSLVQRFRSHSFRDQQYEISY
jgi:dephospho-CoA kinase